ncbi:MAG: DUF502 domain-containing protein [Halobacteriaceae archaeon]
MSGGAVASVRRRAWRVAGLGVVGYFLFPVAFLLGVDGTTAGNAALIMASAPLWTDAISRLAGLEVLGRRAWAGLLVAAAGTAVVVVGSAPRLALSSDVLVGNAFMLAAAALWGAYTVFNRSVLEDVEPLAFTLFGLLAALPLLHALALPGYLSLRAGAVGAAVWAGIAYAGTLATGLAFVWWNTSVKAVGPSRTGAYNNLVPLSGWSVARWRWASPSARHSLRGRRSSSGACWSSGAPGRRSAAATTTAGTADPPSRAAARGPGSLPHPTLLLVSGERRSMASSRFGFRVDRLNQTIRQSFITGIALTVPLIATLIVLGFVIRIVTDFVQPVVGALNYFLGIGAVPEFVLEVFTLVLLFWFFLAVGFVANRRDPQESRLARTFNGLVSNIPGIGSVYTGVKQMSDVVLASDSESFRAVKLVEFPHMEAYMLCFLTATPPATITESAGEAEMQTVFVPLAPNPVMGGFLTYVPTDRVYDIEMSVEEGMRAIMTSGVAVDPRTGPEDSGLTVGDIDREDIEQVESGVFFGDRE